MILCRQGSCVFSVAFLAACLMVAPLARARSRAPGLELAAPIAVYNHEPAPGASHAGPPLSEDRALRDLDQLVRLKKSGLRMDYDLLDTSALAPDGLHPAGRTSAWPNGPDAWIARCRAAGIQPGLRFTANALRPSGRAPAFFDGQFLPDFVAALQSWYDRGIRLFALDGLDLTGAPPANAAGLTNDEIVARNAAALRAALTAFRTKNRGAVLLAIENDVDHPDPSASPSSGSEPSANNPESRDEVSHIGAFRLLSTGPSPGATAPQASLQRAIDIETDDQIRRDEQMGVSLVHILSAGFVAPPAGAAGSSAPGLLRGWKGAFLLSMARGGWVNTLSGSLDSIQSADARWMERVEKLFFAMQAQGQVHSFGGQPFDGQPYGFAGATARGAVIVAVNPSQAVATLSLPPLAPNQAEGPGRVLFRDAGFLPWLTGNAITLGPGQMAAVGSGAYAVPEFDFGVQQDVVIPKSIKPVDADFQLTAPGVLEARIDPPIEGVLRVIVRERVPSGGKQDGNSQAPAAGSNHRLTIEITQGDRPIPLRPGSAGSDGESILNAGLSWAVAEIDVNDLTPGIPLRVRFRSEEKQPVILEGSAYEVIY